jgi:prophage regulatory protein
MKILGIDDLREKGIPFCRQYLHKLVKRGEFPPPIKIGGQRNAWVESEIDAYLKSRLIRRDETKMASSG